MQVGLLHEPESTLHETRQWQGRGNADIEPVVHGVNHRQVSRLGKPVSDDCLPEIRLDMHNICWAAHFHGAGKDPVAFLSGPAQ